MQCKQHHPDKLADTKTRKKTAPGPRERAVTKARYDEILKDPNFRPRTDFPVGRQKSVEFVNEQFGEGLLPPPHLQVVRKESVQEYEKKVDEPTQQAKRSEYKRGEAGEAFVNEQFGEGLLPPPHLQVVRKASVQEYEKKVDEPMQPAKRSEYKHGEAGEALRQLAPQLRICKQEGVLNNAEVSQAIFDTITTHEQTAQTSGRIVTAYEEEVPAKLEGGSSFDGNPGGEREGAGVPEAAAQHPELLGQAQGRSKATTADIERAQMAPKRYYHEFTTENRDDDEYDDDDNHPVTHETARIYRNTHPSRHDEAKGIG
jgi:hypothetical protein